MQERVRHQHLMQLSWSLLLVHLMRKKTLDAFRHIGKALRKSIQGDVHIPVAQKHPKLYMPLFLILLSITGSCRRRRCGISALSGREAWHLKHKEPVRCPLDLKSFDSPSKMGSQWMCLRRRPCRRRMESNPPEDKKNVVLLFTLAHIKSQIPHRCCGR